MKKTIFIVFNLCSLSLFAQIKSPVPNYEKDMLSIDGKKQVFNYKMLNILFANKVGTAFGGTNDLSLQKFFASLDASENSISIGTNFDNRDDEKKKLAFVFSGGLKMKAKDQFSTFYKNGDFQENNVGAFFKITYLFDGTINYTHKQNGNDFIMREKAILENRKDLYEKYNKKAEKYNTEEYNQAKAKQEQLIANSSEALKITEFSEKKSDELYLEMAKEEISYIEDNKLYRSLKDWWVSVDVYVPFGENKYKTTPSIIESPLTDNKFYAASASLSLNHMRVYSSGQSFFLKIKGSLKNNNNIIVDGMTSSPFQTITNGANNISVVTNTDDGYITNFDRFLTTTLMVEPAIFVFNNRIGFSPAIEFNGGKYHKTNWKLGIPVSLKDKDGKPKVNFEVQWKEINTFQTSDHIVGISVNFLFGEMIN